MDLTGRHFLKLLDYTPEEINYFVDLAAELKRLKKAGIPVDTLRGKNVALIFEKTSTRTRSSFEVAAHDLGMGCTYLDPSSSQIGKKESMLNCEHLPMGWTGLPRRVSCLAEIRHRFFITPSATDGY